MLLFERGIMMFWSIVKASGYLGLKVHQVYYLVQMGVIEAVKVGNAWRVMPDAARTYKAKLAA